MYEAVWVLKYFKFRKKNERQREVLNEIGAGVQIPPDLYIADEESSLIYELTLIPCSNASISVWGGLSPQVLHISEKER